MASALALIVKDSQDHLAHEHVSIVESRLNEHVPTSRSTAHRAVRARIDSLARVSPRDVASRVAAAEQAVAGGSSKAAAFSPPAHSRAAAGSIMASSAASMVCCHVFVELGITKPK